ncbi:AsnC family transcriptional regulator [Streptomyces griseoaurantiacus]|nr:AsnC family transcriptional regulator [Streptomyces griseoaurantiacus]
MPVDQLDTRILRLLLEQPRTSVREYARVLGIARGTLQARLDRLERDGVITGTAPSLSPAALGHPVLAFVHVEVTQGRLDEVGDALAEVPEIVEAFSTTGGGDLLTRVVARDNAHLEDLVQTLISIPGVVRTRTEVALRERVRYRLLPLVAAVGRAAGPTPGPGTGGEEPVGAGGGGAGGARPTGPDAGGAGPGGGRG